MTNKVQHIEKGLIDMEHRDYQKNLLKRMHACDNILIQSARQAGLTTCLVKYLADFVNMNEGKTIYIASSNVMISREILNRLMIMLEGEGVESKQSVRMKINSNEIFVVSAKSLEKVIYEEPSVIIVDNAQFIDPKVAFFLTATMTLFYKTKFILASSGINMSYPNWFLSKWFSDDMGEWERFVIDTHMSEAQQLNQKEHLSEESYDSEVLNKIKLHDGK